MKITAMGLTTALVASALSVVGIGAAAAYGPAESSVNCRVYFADTGEGIFPATITGDWTLNQTPSNPNIGDDVQLTVTGDTGLTTGPGPLNADSQTIRITVAVSGAQTEDVALTSTSAYPATTIPAFSNTGPFSATGSYEAVSAGATSAALKLLKFDDDPAKPGYSGSNVDSYCSDAADADFKATGGTASTTIVQAYNQTDVDAVITGVTSGPDTVPAGTPQAMRAGDEISFSSGTNDNWAPSTQVKATICTDPAGASCPPGFVEGILWAGSDPAYGASNPIANGDGEIAETTLLLASTGGNTGAAYFVLYQGATPATATARAEVPVTLLGARTLSGPAAVLQGGTAAVTGTNWYPGETVTLQAGSSASVTTVANASGAISANVPVTDASATSITGEGIGTTGASSPLEVNNLNGTFTRSPASVFATQAVKVTPSNVTGDVSTVSINWGDGKVTNNASKTAPTNHVYSKAGTATIKATLRNASTGLTVVKTVGTVRVNLDKAAPVVTIKALKAKAKKVKKVNGTITDAGLGPKSVTVSLIQKRSNGWYAYNGKKWVKAKNKKQAIKKSKKITVSATNGTWSTSVKKVKKGKITVTYFGTDVAGNKSAAKNYSKKLK